MTVEYSAVVTQTMRKKNKHNQHANMEPKKKGNKIGTNAPNDGDLQANARSQPTFSAKISS